jgi:REP element-mobilizing transposase RayT
MRLVPAIYNCRRQRMFLVLYRALRSARERNQMRICHYSVQSNHLHLIVEAPNAEALARGMQGLAVRIARRVNRHMGREGTVFKDRYHARALKTAWQVRIALRYVLLNARKHSQSQRWQRECLLAETSTVAAMERFRAAPFPVGPKHCPHIDPFSSAVWFAGWKGSSRAPPADALLAAPETAPLGPADPRLTDASPEVARPRTYLLQKGWLSWGVIDPDETPARRG